MIRSYWAGRYFAPRYWTRTYWSLITSDVAVDSAGNSLSLHAPGDWITLGRFFLDSGTEALSDQYVRHPDYLYEGRVLDWGTIDRSIAIPPGLPHVGDATVRVADTDRKFRSLLRGQTPRRRLFEIKIVRERESVSSFEPCYIGEIVKATFPPGAVELTIRDITFAWLDKKIPGLGNRTNFPDLAPNVDEFFIPIIAGVVTSDPLDPQGVIPLPHMGPSDVGDRWALAQHPLPDPAVFRKLPDEETFTVVDASEYQVTQDDPRIIGGIEYNLTFLDFFETQPEGTEIRVDAWGITFRGGFGTMEAVSADSAGEPLRNPIDFLINMLFLMAHETRLPRFNIASFVRAREKFETLLYISDSAGVRNAAYVCDGAITESMTAGEFLGQFLTAFGLHLFTNRNAEIEVRLIDDEGDDDPPVFTDTLDILKDTLTSELPDPTFNRFTYHFARNYATGKWGNAGVWNNAADQYALSTPDDIVFDSTGDSMRTPHVEDEDVELWFIRDSYTALSTIIRRAAFLSLQSFRCEFETPAPENNGRLELAHTIELVSSNLP